MNLRTLGITTTALLVGCGLAERAKAATLALQLQAANYNPTTGVWTDTSGNGDNATYSGSSTPTLVTNATPNGSSAVDLSGSGALLLGSSIAYSSGYTVFAYLQPPAGSGRNAITGGSTATALEWDVYNNKDDFLSEYTSDVAHGTATLSSSSFDLIDLAVSSSSSSFDLNGASDGTGSGVSFGAPITRIGNNEGGGDGYVGNISEIDIYTGILTPAQISTVESQLTAEYVSVPEPASLGLLGLAALGLVGRRRPLVG